MRPDVELRELNVIDTVESWWGDSLSEDLIELIVAAPAGHLDMFFRSCRSEERVRVSTAGRGQFRPLLSHSASDEYIKNDCWHYLSLAPAMALYSHEVLIEDPFSYGWIDIPGQRDDLRSMLKHLLNIAPLARSGVLKFYVDSGARYSRNRHPAFAGRIFNFEQIPMSTDSAVRDSFEALSLRMDAMDKTYASELFFSTTNEVAYALNISAQAPDYFQLCSHDEVTSLFYQLAINAGRAEIRDGKSFRLERLLALSMPEISGRASQITRLRSDSEEFADWRSKLSVALDAIDDISYSDEAWRLEAREILRSELEPVSERITNSVRRSPALRAATSGFRTFSLAGLGTVTSALLGGPVATPVAGLAVAKMSEAVLTYLEAKKRYKTDRAILDIMASITESHP